MVEQPLLEALGAVLRRGIVEQVAGELLEHGVERAAGVVALVAADVSDPAHQLHVQARGDPLVELRRRPPGRAVQQHLGHGVGVGLEPLVQLLQREVDQPVVEVVAQRLGEQSPEEG